MDIGLWVDRATDRRFDGRPAVFLDRDGVLVEEVHFLQRAADVALTAGIAPAIACANAANIPIVVVTNQSGIARGHFGWEAFAEVQARIEALLAAAGARVDMTLACGYHDDGIGDLARDHPWRKPQPGMLLEAARQLGLGLDQSLIVGDRITDLEAGEAAGVDTGALVLTGYGADEAKKLAARRNAWRTSFATSTFATAGDAFATWLAERDQLAAISSRTP